MTISFKQFRILFCLIIASSALLYSGLNPQYRTGVYNDDAEYVIAARNMWHSDAAPQERFEHAPLDFPFPGLPLVLAPWTKLVEPNWDLMEWLAVVVSTLSVFLLGLFLKRFMTFGETLVVLLIYAFNPFIAKYSGVLMPAPFFIVAILGCFLLLFDLLEKSSVAKALGLGVLLGWGSLIRPEGFVLLLSIPLALALARKWKDLLLAVLAPALFWGVFIWHWVKSAKSSATEYGGDITAVLTYWSHHVGEFIQFIGTMLNVLFEKTILAIRFFPSSLATGVTVWITIFCVAASVIGYYSLWKEKRMNRRALFCLALFCGFYLGVHTIWHVAIPRYCIVLLPFVLAFLIRGVNEWLPRSPRRSFYTAAISGVFLISYGNRNGYALYQSLWKPDPFKSPPWRSLAWVEGNTSPTARMLSPIAPSLVLYAQRSAISIMTASNEEDFLSLLMKRHLNYIFDRPVKALNLDVPDSDDPNQNWDRIRRWIRQNPKRYPVLFYDPIEKVTIYRVSPEPGYFEAYEKYVAAVDELQHDHFDQAIQKLRESLTLYPKLASANNALGVAEYLSRKNLKEAEQAFRTAIDIRPDYAYAMLNLARLYYLTGDHDKSLNYLRLGLETGSAEGNEKELLQNIEVSEHLHEIEIPKSLTLHSP